MFNRFQRAFFNQARGMVRISNIQSKHEDAPFVLWIIFAINKAKKWSGQNLTSWTGSAAYGVYDIVHVYVFVCVCGWEGRVTLLII